MTLHLLDVHDSPVGTREVDSTEEVGAAAIEDNFGNRHRVDVDNVQNVRCQSCEEHPCSHEKRTRDTLQDINRREYVLLGLLSSREREYLELRDDSDLSREEIAVDMDVEEGTLKTWDGRIADKRREADDLVREWR